MLCRAAGTGFPFLAPAAPNLSASAEVQPGPFRDQPGRGDQVAGGAAEPFHADLLSGYGPRVDLIEHWWNGRWGTLNRRDVWLEQLDDGRFRVRWRSWDWRDRDGQYITRSAKVAVAAVRALVDDGTETWKQLPVR